MRESVRDYYGGVLETNADLKSDACCEISSPSDAVAAALSNIHPEVSEKYYGCGLVAPEDIRGARVLDLGCGTGRDAFLLAQLVGEDGDVVGVDMTDEQLAVARKHEGWHAERFGFEKPNTRFVKGYIEELDQLGLEPASFDLVVSNCVINLSIDKPGVFAGVASLLKPGGVMHFADVYAQSPVPEALRTDPILYGECLAGALSWDDFLAIAQDTGFGTPALVDHRPLAVTDPELLEKLNGLRFVSATVELRLSEGGCQPTARNPFTEAATSSVSAGCCG